MAPLARPAQAGDLFILLEPVPDELANIREYQRDLQHLFGGRIYENVHVTCQRFTLQDDGSKSDTVHHLVESLSHFHPFSIMTDSLVMVHPPFWQSYMLRWKIRMTEEWWAFVESINSVLEAIECFPHYSIEEPATCTALEMDVEKNVADGSMLGLPCCLFSAQRITLSQLTKVGKHEREFEILATVHLSAEAKA